jgi:hypothetical protein
MNVLAIGLEPMTPRSTIWCSNQLSYASMSLFEVGAETDAMRRHVWPHSPPKDTINVHNSLHRFNDSRRRNKSTGSGVRGKTIT